jgi:hypothetical protein
MNHDQVFENRNKSRIDERQEQGGQESGYGRDQGCGQEGEYSEERSEGGREKSQTSQGPQRPPEAGNQRRKDYSAQEYEDALDGQEQGNNSTSNARGSQQGGREQGKYQEEQDQSGSRRNRPEEVGKGKREG